MIWDIIADKIEGAGLAVAGESLFLQAFPADVTEGVGLFEPLGGVVIDPYIPGFYKPELRVIVRSTSIARGSELANAVMEVLTVKQEEKYPLADGRGPVSLKVFYPKNLPIRFPALDGKAFEWSLNFRTAFSIQPQ